MKKSLLFLCAVIAVLNTSCSVANNSHSQVMDSEVINQTKFGILNKYGNPTQKRILGSYEEWTYDMSKSSVNKKRLSPNVISSSDQAAGNSYNRGSSLSGTYNNYMKITFHNGRVTKWETKGVDYGEKSKNSGALAILILTTLGLSLALSVIASASVY